MVATSLVTNLILTSPQAQGRSRWDKCEKGEKKMSKLGRIVLVSMVVLLVLTTLVLLFHKAVADGRAQKEAVQQVAELQKQLDACKATAAKPTSVIVVPVRPTLAPTKPAPAKKVTVPPPTAPVVAVPESLAPNTLVSGDFSQFKTEAARLATLYGVVADKHRLFFSQESNNGHYLVRSGVVPATLAYDDLVSDWADVVAQRDKVISVSRQVISGPFASNGEKDKVIDFVGKMSNWPAKTRFVSCANSATGAIDPGDFKRIQDSAKEAELESKALAK